MLCPYCKEKIADGAVKCKHCGSAIGTGKNAALKAGSSMVGKAVKSSIESSAQSTIRGIVNSIFGSIGSAITSVIKGAFKLK
jgi:uncharacterized membrane protein YvbJ